MTTIFFRDDDVGELDQPLRCVVELLVEEEIPCSYQMVPKFLGDAAAAYVTATQRDHPGFVRLNQHGLHHDRRSMASDVGVNSTATAGTMNSGATSRRAGKFLASKPIFFVATL